MKNINLKNYEEINYFFREYIYRIESPKKTTNILGFKNNNGFVPSRPPYILSPREKPYTLVLGLDETLANFQQINYTQGVLKLRPYLTEFLENVSRYYELILFTSKTQYYAEPIIRAIEQKKKYFDFIFYRENCIMIKNEFVKDLTRIGRSLDSIIIVDNMPEYFRLQKENGIIIKSFWAKDPNDRALYDLIPILIRIAQEEIDVREGISKYRNEIYRKITSSFSNNYI
jgi:CTD small phosphatase-like protein 2